MPERAIEIEGLCVPFNTPGRFENPDRVIQVRPGAFTQCLRDPTVYVTTRHGSHRLGSVADRGLVFSEGDDGLHCWMWVAAPWSDIIDRYAKAGELHGFSVRWFSLAADCADEVITVRRGMLEHVSIVFGDRRPVYPQTYARVTRRWS